MRAVLESERSAGCTTMAIKINLPAFLRDTGVLKYVSGEKDDHKHVINMVSPDTLRDGRICMQMIEEAANLSLVNELSNLMDVH